MEHDGEQHDDQARHQHQQKQATFDETGILRHEGITFFVCVRKFAGGSTQQGYSEGRAARRPTIARPSEYRIERATQKILIPNPNHGPLPFVARQLQQCGFCEGTIPEIEGVGNQFAQILILILGDLGQGLIDLHYLRGRPGWKLLFIEIIKPMTSPGCRALRVRIG